ncbi:hypothetical protein [Fructilactobacillus carniphilus]|uniref:DUF4868 domain-containing protein n=1 Tax=Fructilactobacillus carniphilus TaxID=2940297 RepID=A0ABY5BWB3_9LACO|nr:hypothetical protein [Fructilactobacillus carniphilus]USS90801.1 hypothetical protein M3M37_00815 [Fructilactobacillus carniphilus]
MSVLLVKSSLNNDGDFFRVAGIENNIFNDFDLNRYDFIEFNPNVLIDDNQIYYIENFSEYEFCLDILRNDFNTIDFDNFNAALDKKLLLQYDNDVFYFQKITKSMLGTKKILRFLNDGNRFEVFNNSQSISINDEPDATYNKENDTLYFKKFSRIKNIFNGIYILYRDATDDEIIEFLNQQFIECVGGFGYRDVRDQNRKRIAILVNEQNIDFNNDIDDLEHYLGRYTELNINRFNRVEISSDKDLKNLIYGIQERYYTTEVHNYRRIANSVIDIGD